MQAREVASGEHGRTIIAILDPGEEAFKTLGRLAAEQAVTGASVVAIGAFERAVVGFFDLETKSYREIPVEEQVEVLSLIGDIAVADDGTPSVHLHAVLGLKDGTTRGGHFISGIVRPTLEVTITETPIHLRRRERRELGIALIDLPE